MNGMFDKLITGLFFATGASAVSYVLKLLTLNGAIAQFVLGVVLLGLGGWQWTVPILVFFLSSSLLSKIKNKRKTMAIGSFDKDGQRDALQVLANGAVPGITLLAFLLTRSELFYVAHLSAIAAATADTWGTEIGTMSRSEPFMVTSLRRVQPGMSGAISPLGVAAGFAGAAMLAATGAIWLVNPFQSGFVVLAAGVLGSILDSVIGAQWQIQFRCPICGALVERGTHCDSRTARTGGMKWVNNDMTNLISIGLAALFGLVASFLLN